MGEQDPGPGAEPDSGPHVAALMFVAYRHAEERIIGHVVDSGFPITLAQARVCARISEDGIRLTELAEQSQVTKQTAGFLVDQVEKAGYVERVPDPTDARARLIRLSDKGWEVQRCAREMEEIIDAEWTAHLGASRVRTLRATLEDLREITDPYM